MIVLGGTISELVSAFGINDAQFATILGVQPRTVERWKAEEAFPQHESRSRLNELIELEGRLNETFKSADGVRRWLHSKSGYFGGLTPLDALLGGRIDLVDAALEAIDSGVIL